MVYESGQSSIHGNNPNKRQKHSPNSIPEDSNVIQFISKFANNYTGMIKEEHWSSHLLNHLNNQYPTSIPISHLSNQFHTSMESTSQHIYGFQNLNQPLMWDVSHIPVMYSGFDNSGSSMSMGYNGYNSASSNISNHQYFGGSSIKNVGSTNIFSGGMNLNCPLDVNQADMEIDTSYDVPPGSFFHSITSSSAANFHQGQSPYSNRVLPCKCNSQRSNFRTNLQPQVQTLVPNQSSERTYELPVQSDNQSSHQSNRFKIPRLNLWEPVQSHPLVAEHHWRRNCYGLNCKVCTLSEKQTYDFLEPTSNESWVESGTLMEVLLSFLNRSDGDRFSQESSALQQPALEPSEDVSVVKPKPLTMDSGPEVSSIVSEDIIESNQILKGSEENIDTTNDELKEASNLSFEEFSAWLNQQHVPLPLPDLEPCEDVSITTEYMIENNQISEVNIDTMNDDFKEPPEVRFEEKASDGNEESSQVGAELICGFNSPSDYYESFVESTQTTIPIVRESSENKKTTITSFDNVSGSGSGKIKKPSASLADYLSASQIIEHLSSLIKHNNKEKLGSTTQSVGQNPCQLCSMYKLPLAPAPIYCSSCDSPIKQDAGYYLSSVENTNTQHCFCKKCFTGSRKAINLIRGGSISKANLRQAKNDEETLDSWVQCDRCQLWQHRICGLYNDERDEEGKAEYICPKCHLKEIENENAVPAVKSFLGAKHLPRTNLSDHIEQRLFRRMKQEREEAAKFYGTTMENVPEAEALVVRVVVSVDKELEVKQHFRDIFQGEDYPEKIAYRSKLILLFQKIGGVDLCLFGMYVQEYGSECDGPNKRCVYISYLDSVKYFQPERKTASGESLRTFVYHEILIGYLEYCKKRGFAACYIWACPPDGNDYIFYCHPKTQKTPKENKLRQWYKSMLRKAAKDGVIVEHTNLYDRFFVPTNHGNAKITAAHLPYFDGNYWSPLAESISKKLEEDEKTWGVLRGKSPSKRTKDNPTKDALVMRNLGEDILPKKENFMIVRLQYVCTCCNEVILSGSRWSCNYCNKIHLCSRCFDDGKLLSPSRMHTCHSGKSRLLSEDILRHIPVDTKDKDDVLVNKFFADRDDFLYKCQKSQYQFDTIGHAKYSSMMILYHITHSLVLHLNRSLCYNHEGPSLSS